MSDDLAEVVAKTAAWELLFITIACGTAIVEAWPIFAWTALFCVVTPLWLIVHVVLIALEELKGQ